jgi:hypothetical protein
MEQKNKEANMKRGYDLAAEALRHLADKISSSSTNDEDIKVSNELIKQTLDVGVQDIIQKAKRMDEFYKKLMAPGPWNQDPDIFSPLSDDEQKEINSMRSLICFALAVYGDDLSKTKKVTPTRFRTRNLSDEDLKDLENVDLQLDIIEDVMREDYCSK